MTAMGLSRGPRVRVSGRVLLDGEDLLGAAPERLRELRGDEIAMVFQDPLSALHPLLRGSARRSSRRCARIPGRLARGGARPRVELLELGRDPERAPPRGRLPARVLRRHAPARDDRDGAGERAELLIADEPTTALDVTVQAQILALLQPPARELAMALVFITHDLGVVAEVAQDVLVMQAGQIVERAPTAELFAAPQHPYTKRLLHAMPTLDGPPPPPLPRADVEPLLRVRGWSSTSRSHAA